MIDDSAWVWRMSGLTRGGTAVPASRGQILSDERGQGNFIFHVQLTTSTISNQSYLVDVQPGMMRDDHSYIHTFINTFIDIHLCFASY